MNEETAGQQQSTLETAPEGLVTAPLPGGIQPLLSVQQAARYLGKSPRWLWNALALAPEQAGSIPSVRVGGTHRFILEDLQAWVRQGCPSAANFAEWQKFEKKHRRSR